MKTHNFPHRPTAKVLAGIENIANNTSLPKAVLDRLNLMDGVYFFLCLLAIQRITNFSGYHTIVSISMQLMKKVGKSLSMAVETVMHALT